MTQLAEALFYLAIVMDPMCTLCASRVGVTRVELGPEPSSFAWACPGDLPSYEALRAAQAPKQKRLPVVA